MSEGIWNMDRIKNLILYCDTKKAGKCPKCQNENIEVTEHPHGERKPITFVCKDCGAFAHFD